jgi:hypothetical protein
MKKSELAAMTVAELNALARKKKVSLSPSAKKADIIAALMASGIGKPAAKHVQRKNTQKTTTSETPEDLRSKAPTKKYCGSGNRQRRESLRGRPGYFSGH